MPTSRERPRLARNIASPHAPPVSRHRVHIRRALFAALLFLGAPLTAAPPLAVRIAFIGPADGDAQAGARQGIKEANAQGKFLGLSYELVAAADMAAALAAKASAVVVDGEASALPAQAAAARDIPVLNVRAEDDSLRTLCTSNLLHTIPSKAMRADAVAQWHRNQPDSHAAALAWHASAERYAGSQLNKRYNDATGRAMNDTAWAAWAAVKLVSDTVARLKTTDAATLLPALRKDLAFDGQKGADLSFRDNGQLRQPLLLVEDDKIIAEAPVRGVAADGDLDSLGNTPCTK